MISHFNVKVIVPLNKANKGKEFWAGLQYEPLALCGIFMKELQEIGARFIIYLETIAQLLMKSWFNSKKLFSDLERPLGF